jgi:steroid delta-isomerase-like uncharacterized protein
MTTARENTQKAFDAINKRDVAAFSSTYAADAVLHDPSYPQPIRGRQAIEKDLADTLRAFPDLRTSIAMFVEDGDHFAVRWTLEGTNTGPIDFPTLRTQPTGRTIKVEGAAFSRLNHRGEVVEEHRYYDLATWAAQLGLA